MHRVLVHAATFNYAGEEPWIAIWTQNSAAIKQPHNTTYHCETMNGIWEGILRPQPTADGIQDGEYVRTLIHVLRLVLQSGYSS